MFKKQIFKISLLSLICSNFLFAEEITKTSYVNVIESREIFKTVEYNSRSSEECWEERVPVVERYEREIPRENTNTLGLDTLLGVAVGSVVGHQIGGGNGQKVATVAGGLIGGYTANQTRNMGNSVESEYVQTTKLVTRCRDIPQRESRDVFSHYENIAEYNGIRIVKNSTERLRKIRITTTISY